MHTRFIIEKLRGGGSEAAASPYGSCLVLPQLPCQCQNQRKRSKYAWFRALHGVLELCQNTERKTDESKHGKKQ